MVIALNNILWLFSSRDIEYYYVLLVVHGTYKFVRTFVHVFVHEINWIEYAFSSDLLYVSVEWFDKPDPLGSYHMRCFQSLYGFS